jgi:alkylation response protein AidB-like acyl-CoA dehydrogenase
MQWTAQDIDLLRATARRFVTQRLHPLEAAIDAADEIEAELDIQIRREAHDLGLYGFNFPQTLGGPGLPAAAKAAVYEEITRTSMPLVEAIGHLPLTLAYCSAQQQSDLLPDIVAGKKVMTYALTEASAGSDLSAIQTRGTPVPGGWLISGSKQFISNAESADFLTVLTVTNPQASLKDKLTTFIVRRDNPGIKGMTRYRKMGWRGYQLNGFVLEDCFVPDQDVLGPVGQGFEVMMSCINTDRVFSGYRALGIAQRAQDMAIAYAKQRVAFGSPLSEHQAIQFMLADSDVELTAARLLVNDALSLTDAGDRDARIAASRAKLYATEIGCRVVDRAMQVFGGMGYMTELPIERFYRDIRAFRIGEGTSEMQRIQISRHLLRDR